MARLSSRRGTVKSPKKSSAFNTRVIFRYRTPLNINHSSAKWPPGILGASMLNRLTVSALLQSVILVTSFCVVIGFSLNAWDSWGRLQLTNRIAVIADASANMFKAMDRLRSDRSTTNRLLNSDQPLDSEMDKYLRGLRDAEMPAMGRALELVARMEFPQQQTLVPDFDRQFKTLSAEQKEFWDE